MKKTLQITGIAGIIAVASLFGVFASNYDTTIEKGYAALADVTLEKQLNDADLAIVGTVKEIQQPYPDKNAHPDIPRYFGDVIVTVEEVLRGEITEKEIIIRTHANVREEASFEENERMILFLTAGVPESVEGKGVYVVRGMYQGKYSLQNDMALDPKQDGITYSEIDLKSRIKATGLS